MIWIEFKCNIAHSISRACVLLSDKGHIFRNVTDGGRLNVDGLGMVLASMYARVERHAHFRHRRVLHPTVVSVPGQELDKRVCGLYHLTSRLLYSVALPHRRVEHLSTHRAQLFQYECLAPCVQGADEKGRHVQESTYFGTRNVFYDDFPLLDKRKTLAGREEYD